MHAITHPLGTAFDVLPHLSSPATELPPSSDPSALSRRSTLETTLLWASREPSLKCLTALEPLATDLSISSSPAFTAPPLISRARTGPTRSRRSARPPSSSPTSATLTPRLASTRPSTKSSPRVRSSLGTSRTSRASGVLRRRTRSPTPSSRRCSPSRLLVSLFGPQVLF